MPFKKYAMYSTIHLKSYNLFSIFGVVHMRWNSINVIEFSSWKQFKKFKHICYVFMLTHKIKLKTRNLYFQS